ncbi:D-2-hydroxyacid dehydrogenase [Cupriavidus sp. L7L]|uniref:D-2-hydroxyacid dehydrogenase n=1 Tax=Cupriavidus sp. L7L TaxID=2546443 RepID=UPI0010559A54|nr:D-2-hydroxyacid dehydrogenase [Cupriavidus sp. L7L]TDF62148.1 D-2-hydroxyacid dehydrogenase [Cupriavidus sp. L7L]
MTNEVSLTLMMSEVAREAFGARISAVLKELPHRFVTPRAVLNSGPVDSANVAFLTRDVTGNSGKTQLAPSLVEFYDAMRASAKLSWLQSHAAGADRPIYAELRQRGVTVTTASGANAGAVAQMAFLGVLAIARRLPQLMDAQRRKSWEPLLGERAPHDLKRQTAAVVGLGPIGLEVARLLDAIGMHVIGMSRRIRSVPGLAETVSFAELESVLPKVSVVVLACPLTDITRGLLNRKTLALLPAGSILVNVSRGEVVVESDLIQCLQDGHLGGAFLDVFEKEPLSPDSALWTLPTVMIAPHTAGHTTGHYAEVGEIFLDNLTRWRDGLTLRNTVA